ncbi:hypothetical protein ATO12_09240 [Aquimarina atlantica]|uniref:HTH araC/xylS-type domain-containing protein n=1 Tax=Aquimarina atlantica TaxID=1317122 RepID=A0A023BXU3_9FLAO|nr:helix-turn-helix domain-containing protein [Aquimarina atlantica]EZH74907.1 hypothetical protein ATO12_09240 [Aquimarina atlantica]
MNFINLLLLISASQGFIFGLVILFSPLFRSKANNFLGYSILILSLLMLNMFLDNIGFFKTYPKLKIIDDIEWIFLFPVTFFFYIVTLIAHDVKKNKKLKWLYAPIVLSIILNMSVNLETDYGAYTVAMKHKEYIFSLLFDLEKLGYYTFNLLMGLWLYILIQKSDILDKNSQLKWVKSLWILVFFMTLIWIILYLIRDENFNINPDILKGILPIGLSFFIYWVFYNGIYRLKLVTDRKEILSILNRKNLIHKNSKTDVLDKNKLQGKKTEMFNDIDMVSSHTFSKSNLYFKKLESFLYDDYIYRDPNLSREVVAEKLNISPGYLSQIINAVTNNNFTAYINSFRVEEVKKMIVNEEFDKYSLLAIGLEAGFKSKTTFYSAFKKETGLTPSEFKSRHK